MVEITKKEEIKVWFGQVTQKRSGKSHGLLNSSIWTGNEAKITDIADQHEA